VTLAAKQVAVTAAKDQPASVADPAQQQHSTAVADVLAKLNDAEATAKKWQKVSIGLSSAMVVLLGVMMRRAV